MNANDGWAVGDAVGIPAPTNLLLERWNGTNWTRVLPASVLNDDLRSVYCFSSTDCWAVGNAIGANLLFMRWNGSTWTRVLPAVALNEDLRGVFCTKTDDCWAVGNDATLEHWDGIRWVRATAPVTYGNQLNAVAMVAAPNDEPQAAWEETFP